MVFPFNSLARLAAPIRHTSVTDSACRLYYYTLMKLLESILPYICYIDLIITKGRIIIIIFFLIFMCIYQVHCKSLRYMLYKVKNVKKKF